MAIINPTHYSFLRFFLVQSHDQLTRMRGRHDGESGLWVPVDSKSCRDWKSLLHKYGLFEMFLKLSGYLADFIHVTRFGSPRQKQRIPLPSREEVQMEVED